jgi:hypothetical protein
VSYAAHGNGIRSIQTAPSFAQRIGLMSALLFTLIFIAACATSTPGIDPFCFKNKLCLHAQESQTSHTHEKRLRLIAGAGVVR